MISVQARIQRLREDIDAFHLRYQVLPSTMIESGNHRFQIAPAIGGDELTAVQKANDIELPEQYFLFLTQIGDGVQTDGCRLTPFQEALEHTTSDLRAAFPHLEAWNPEYEGPMLEDSADRIGAAEYERRQRWMMWWSGAEHTAGSLVVEDMGCGYFRHLVVNGQERGHLWEDVRAADEGILPVTLNGQRATFLDFYEHKIRHTLQGLENEL